ncbi:MAG: PAS domain S-box protein [Salinibacter sp.]
MSRAFGSSASPETSASPRVSGGAFSEATRAQILRRYVGQDTAPTLDRIVRVAATLFGTATAKISFVGDSTVWDAATVGMDLRPRAPEESLCAHTVQSAEPTVVRDAAKEERWADHPQVEEGLRFYAGVPLTGPEGPRVGALWVADAAPQTPSSELLRRLEDLAAMGSDALDLRRDDDGWDEGGPAGTAGVSEGIFRMTPDEGLVYANRAFADLFGYDTVAAAKAADPSDFFEDPTARRDLWAHLRDHGHVDTREVVFQRTDGSSFVGRLSATAVHGEEGELRCYDGLIADRADPEEVTRQHRRDRDRLRRTQEVGEVGGWEYDPDTDTLEGTEQFYRLIGAPQDAELDRERALDVYPPPARERVAAAVDRCLDEGTSFDLEVPCVSETGTQRWVRAKGELRGSEESLPRLVGTLQDITDRKKIEDTLQEREALLSSVTENVSDGIYRSTPEDGIVYANSAFVEMFGYDSLDELRDVDPTNLYADAEEREDLYQREAEQGGLDGAEVRFRRKDGSTFVGLLSTQNIEEGDEAPTFYDGAVTDITERKQSRLQLERYREYTDRMLNGIDDLFFVFDEEVQFRRWNESVCEVTGYTDETLQDMSALEFFPESARDRAIAALEEGFETGYAQLEAPLMNKDGTTTPYEFVWNLVEHPDGGRRAVGIGRNIVERKQQQQRLRERRQKVEVLYTATGKLLRAESKDAVADCLVSLVDDTLGYPGTTIRFAKDGQLEPSRVPSMVRNHMPERPAYDLDGDTPAAQAYRAGETRAYEDLSANDNVEGRGDIRGTAYVPMGEHGLISVGSLDVGGIDSFDLRLLEVLAAYATLVLDRLDYEETLRQAKEEAEAARAEAETASRTKSAFLANMSHEIRTPLTSIIGFAEAIGTEASELPTPGPLEEYARLIERSGQRLLDTLEGVLNLSKLQAGEMDLESTSVRLAQEAQRAVAELRERADENDIDLKVEAETTPLRAMASEGGVQIVARNLISNAIKYTEEGGSVVVRVCPDEEERVMLEVEDTGIGMETSKTDRLFEPFRQASEGLSREYEGTGIGLAVTQEATQRMGGTIEVDSEKGEGSCFTVRLPRAEGTEDVEGDER